MSDKRKFQDGCAVVWDAEQWQLPIDNGVVRGYATIDLPVCGPMVIVEVENLISDVYPYTCFTIQESALSLKPSKKE